MLFLFAKNRNQLKSLLGIETEKLAEIVRAARDRNQLKSLLGIETQEITTCRTPQGIAIN